MKRFRAALPLLLTWLATPLLAQPGAGVSFAVSEETVPAGGVAQIKVFLTEAKPIVRTGFLAEYDIAMVDSFLGISAAEGMSGIARIRNGRFRVDLSANNPALGDPDYPFLTIAVRTRPGLPAGASFPFALDLGASSWISPSGQPYPAEAKPGSVTIGGSMFIADVFPGGGTLAPGEWFRVSGRGFEPGVEVRAEGARLVSSTPNELVMVARRRLQLDGTRIRVELPNREMQTYFSYLRATKTAPSANPALDGVAPVYSDAASLLAMAPLLPQPASVIAVGLQNPTAEPVSIELEAVNVLGQPQLHAAFVLDPRTSTLRSFEELLGGPVPPTAYALVVRSGGPVQFTMAAIDMATDAVRVPNVITLRRAAY